MAYPPPPPPPMQGPPPIGQPVPRPPRPATVTGAVATMLVVVVLNLVGAAISLITRDEVNDAVEREVANSGGNSPDTAITEALSLGVSLVLSIVFVVLALLLLRGSNGGRIATWVISGVWLLCGFCGLASSFFLLAIEGIPGWITAYSIVSASLSVILHITIIVLLLLPASNAYFKPQPPGQFY